MEHLAMERAEEAVQRIPTPKFGELIGESPAMTELFALAEKIAPCDVTALITGETGTGKELLARAIHDRSARASGPFVAFSCANLPDTLIDDELFGHEKGAFTGAAGPRYGRFEAAHRGTLFLDEIGDLPLALQARLLRVLQERKFERLGGSATIAVDIRLICATHRDLEAMVKQGTFRQDLLYRLNVMQLRLPPLRDRRGDIISLAQSFLARFASRFDKQVTGLTPGALTMLMSHDWPGNVRELENIVQRAVALAESSTVDVKHLPAHITAHFAFPPEPETGYEAEVREFKRRLITRTLRECGGNKSEAARTLGLARPYLHRLIDDLELTGYADAFRGQRHSGAGYEAPVLNPAF
jgi:two-component system, NtrC family, response regulator HydG